MKPIREGGGVYDWIYKGVSRIAATAKLDAVIDYTNQKRDGIRYIMEFSAENQRFKIRDERIEAEKPDNEHHTEPYFYYHFNNGYPFINVIERNGDIDRRELKAEEVDFESSIISQRKDPDQYPEITYIGNVFSQSCCYTA